MPKSSAARVRVVPFDPAWSWRYEAEAARLRAGLDLRDFEIHHIGSTAMRGVFAKPVIDMLLVVADLNALDARGDGMRGLGYEVKGEYGIPGRRYFRLSTADGIRTHQLHAFASGSAEAMRHLAFRDYMNAHPHAAQAYSDLKRGLAHRFPVHMAGYVEGKASFIRQHEALAIGWQQRKERADEAASESSSTRGDAAQA
ncbi:GrpB family protein [soil metagenome]